MAYIAVYTSKLGCFTENLFTKPVSTLIVTCPSATNRLENSKRNLDIHRLGYAKGPFVLECRKVLCYQEYLFNRSYSLP